MSATSKWENAKAAREARDHVASSPGSSSTAAVVAAMGRYLSAEQFHELNEGEGHSPRETKPTDDQ